MNYHFQVYNPRICVLREVLRDLLRDVQDATQYDDMKPHY